MEDTTKRVAGNGTRMIAGLADVHGFAIRTGDSSLTYGDIAQNAAGRRGEGSGRCARVWHRLPACVLSCPSPHGNGVHTRTQAENSRAGSAVGAAMITP